MAADNLLSNIGPSTPPLQTPLTDKDGHLSPVWFAWFNQVGRRTGVTLPNAVANSGLPQGLVSPVTIQDTHAHRSNYNAKSYLGAFYFETDRTIFYMSALVANLATWIYSHGTMIAALASRPAAGTLGTADTGFLFLASDTKDLYEFDGAAWQYYGGAQAAQDFDPVTDGGASLGSAALRFLNLFLKTGLNLGGANAILYPEEILGANKSQLHLNDTDADSGAYFMGSTNATAGNLTGLTLVWGAAWSGTQWIAKAATAAILRIGVGGAFTFYVNTGLAVTSPFTPAIVFQIDASGNITIAAAITASGNINTSGVYQKGATQVVQARQTGWTAWTGASSKASVATGSASVGQCAQAIKALLDDLIAHGLIGP